jgi:hypothetical protein
MHPVEPIDWSQAKKQVRNEKADEEGDASSE